MSEHDLPRQPVKLGSRTVYVRELGYYEAEEIHSTAGESEKNANRRGIAIILAMCVASLENKDGTPAFTLAEFKRLGKADTLKLQDAVLKAQGMDLSEGEGQTGDPEGNA
jgi:hypothetical protein